MNEMLKNIIKEEFEKAMSKKYSEKEINDAILKKHFIHTKDGHVYSPVEMTGGRVTGIDSDYQHVNISIDEIELIESSEDRFSSK